MIKITVSASREYDVVMKRGALSEASELMAEAGITPSKKLCVVADETTGRLFGEEGCDLWQDLAGAGFDMYRYVFEGGERARPWIPSQASSTIWPTTDFPEATCSSLWAEASSAM